MSEIDFWKTILQLRRLTKKDNIAAFKRLREQNIGEFDLKALNLSSLLSSKITNIDQDISKLILERIYLQEISNKIKQACPGVLHALKVDRNDILETDSSKISSCEWKKGYMNNTNIIWEKWTQNVLTAKTSIDRRKSFPSQSNEDQTFTVNFSRKRLNSLCKEKSYFPMFKFSFDTISPHDKIMEIVDRELDSDDENIKTIIDRWEKNKTKKISIIIFKRWLLINPDTLFESKKTKSVKPNINNKKKKAINDIDNKNKNLVERKLPSVDGNKNSVNNFVRFILY